LIPGSNIDIDRRDNALVINSNYIPKSVQSGGCLLTEEGHLKGITVDGNVPEDDGLTLNIRSMKILPGKNIHIKKKDNTCIISVDDVVDNITGEGVALVKNNKVKRLQSPDLALVDSGDAICLHVERSKIFTSVGNGIPLYDEHQRMRTITGGTNCSVMTGDGQLIINANTQNVPRIIASTIATNTLSTEFVDGKMHLNLPPLLSSGDGISLVENGRLKSIKAGRQIRINEANGCLTLEPLNLLQSTNISSGKLLTDNNHVKGIKAGRGLAITDGDESVNVDMNIKGAHPYSVLNLSAGEIDSFGLCPGKGITFHKTGDKLYINAPSADIPQSIPIDGAINLIHDGKLNHIRCEGTVSAVRYGNCITISGTEVGQIDSPGHRILNSSTQMLKVFRGGKGISLTSDNSCITVNNSYSITNSRSEGTAILSETNTLKRLVVQGGLTIREDKERITIDATPLEAQIIELKDTVKKLEGVLSKLEFVDWLSSSIVALKTPPKL